MRGSGKNALQAHHCPRLRGRDWRGAALDRTQGTSRYFSWREDGHNFFKQAAAASDPTCVLSLGAGGEPLWIAPKGPRAIFSWREDGHKFF
jgi:hypothetical protein